ncbi:MAG TPA: hypothetical protein VK990_06420 [Acidimicrobiia bacterium]|nr:hypothetical protein [Acidimicrobiia bacterium]
MSHLRPEDLAALDKRSCRRGRHRYGAAQHIGGGILRQVCAGCGSVTIDLTRLDDDPGPSATRRQGGRRPGI